jgi:hypothetical protein
VYELVVSVRFNRCFKQTILGSIEVFDIFNIFVMGLLIGLQVQRYKLWTLALGDKPFKTQSEDEAFNWLMQYKGASVNADWLVPWCMLLAYSRVFMYLQYNERLGSINETIQSSMNDLVGVCIIFLFVLLSFSMSAYYLWGHTVKRFYTITESLSTMMRMMLSGNIGDFNELLSENVISAYLLFLLFIILSWLVILNITVSILSNAFGAVYETKFLTERPSWDPVIVLRDIQLYITRLMEPNDLELPADFLPSTAYYVNSKFVVQSLLAVDVLKGRNKEDRITLDELQYLTRDFLDSDRAADIFRKALQQVGNQNARVRQQKMAKKEFDQRKKMTSHIVNQTTLISQAHGRIFGHYIPPNTNAMPSWMGHEDDVTMDDVKNDVARISESILATVKGLDLQDHALMQLNRNIDDLRSMKKSLLIDDG